MTNTNIYNNKASLLLLAFLLLNLLTESSFSLLLSILIISYWIITIDVWKSKASSKLAIIIFFVCIAVIFFFNINIDMFALFKRFENVYWLLFSISLLRRLSNDLDISSSVSSFFHGDSPKKDTFLLSSYTALLSWPLSLGAIPILIDTLKNKVDNPFILAALIMRMVCATMLLMPTTIGSAAVYSVLPNIGLSEILIIGFPLFLVSLILCQIRPISFSRHSKALKSNSKKPLYYFLLFWIFFVIGYFFFALNSIQSISMAALMIYGIFVFYDKQNIKQYLNDVETSSGSISPEFMLLTSCALLSQVATHLTMYIPDHIILKIANMSMLQIHIIIMLILPLLCIIGIHPMALFSVSFPIFSAYIGEGASTYIIWVMMFTAAQLLSPVSINAIFAANSLQKSSITTSFMMHMGYFLILNSIAVVYLTYIY